jgi:hypothetical protein
LLYLGECQFIDEFTKENFYHAYSEELCNLANIVVDLLKKTFEIAPKIPFDLLTYRTEKNMDPANQLCNLKEGNYYKSNGLLSTSISPFFWQKTKKIWQKEKKNNKKKMNIHYIFLIPQNSRGLYINHPYHPWFKKSTIVANNEFEILLPVNTLFKIVKKYKYPHNNSILYIMELVYQSNKDIEYTNLDDLAYPEVGTFESNRSIELTEKTVKLMIMNLYYNDIIDFRKSYKSYFISVLPEFRKKVQKNILYKKDLIKNNIIQTMTLDLNTKIKMKNGSSVYIYLDVMNDLYYDVLKCRQYSTIKNNTFIEGFYDSYQDPDFIENLLNELHFVYRNNKELSKHSAISNMITSNLQKNTNFPLFIVGRFIIDSKNGILFSKNYNILFLREKQNILILEIIRHELVNDLFYLEIIGSISPAN